MLIHSPENLSLPDRAGLPGCPPYVARRRLSRQTTEYVEAAANQHLMR
jgi:hypothetical protein